MQYILSYRSLELNSLLTVEVGDAVSRGQRLAVIHSEEAAGVVFFSLSPLLSADYFLNLRSGLNFFIQLV